MDGENARKLACGDNIGTGMWSLDSKRVTFMATEKAGEGTAATSSGLDGQNLTPIGMWKDRSRTLHGQQTAKRCSSPPLQAPAREHHVWKVNVDGSGVEKFLEHCYAMEASPDGKYLLGIILSGKDTGIYAVSLQDRKRLSLVPGVNTFMAAHGE